MINSWAFVFKKKHMRCFLGNEQRMYINYMQSKISVSAIRVQKKQHMRCFVGEEQRMHINYMQNKISVIRAIRVQKKAYIYALSLR